MLKSSSINLRVDVNESGFSSKGEGEKELARRGGEFYKHHQDVDNAREEEHKVSNGMEELRHVYRCAIRMEKVVQCEDHMTATRSKTHKEFHEDSHSTEENLQYWLERKCREDANWEPRFSIHISKQTTRNKF